MAKVAIIGAGFVGRAWAITFARAGHEVALWDTQPEAPEAAISFIETVLPHLADNDMLNGRTPADVRSRLSGTARIEEALTDAEYVQENTPEVLEIKRELFAKLDPLAPPNAVLASSTSAILPSKFTEVLAGRGRCLVAHPLNPPYIIPAVEVVPAPWTTAETVERARDFLAGAGQAPIVMKRELDGFIMNRMQGVLLDEAFRLVEDGYASIEDVDIGIREGLALRWSFMGPFETIDLNAPGGVRDYVQRYEGIYEHLHPSQLKRPHWNGPVLEEVERDRRKSLPADKLAERQVWRDRRLMALVAHKRRAAREIGS